MSRVSDIHEEIVLIARCNKEDAKIIHRDLLSHFGELGGVKFSQFAEHVRKFYLLLGLNNSRN
jgi:hypothetical protein